MADLVKELIQETPPLAWFPFLLLSFLLFAHRWLTTAKTRKEQQQENRLPPSPPAMPIIGHLHLVGSRPHVSLHSLARKHGPDVMLLCLGAVPTLVVSSPRAAEAVLRTHDRVFASRPRSVVADIILYGSCDVAFAPYGEYWRQARKLMTTHLLSVRRVQSFRGAAIEEVSMVMAKISEVATAGGMVDMSELLNSFSNDMACRIVSGKFFLKEGRTKLLRDLINDSSQLLGGFNLEDYFPALARVGVLKRTVCAKAERVRNRWGNLLDKVINDRVSKEKSTFDHKDADFVDILLSIQHEYDLTREHMKALLTESLRLHPVAPFLAPHLAMADCSVDGYMVPAGTRVIINVWSIGRDATSWEDAEEFRPERFVGGGSDVHVNFKGNDFQFLPFGAGRRMCPGINLGITNVELMLANLMYHFDWESPLGLERKDIDMTEVFGLTVHRKEKLLLIPKAHM
ncbi:hypothetical protein ACQ4PT_059978 [Festuca glaucescens]